MTLATAWFRPAPSLVTAWLGPSGALEEILREAASPADVPAIIGPRGPQGLAGDPGPPGVIADPGDLVLYFQNGMT